MTCNGVPAPLPLMPLAFRLAFRASKLSRLSPSLCSPAFGLGHGAHEEPVAEVGRADVRSTQRARPVGVALSLQLGRDPVKSSRTRSEPCNILKENCRAAEAEGEREEVWPEVALIGLSESLPGDGMRLAQLRDAAGEQIDLADDSPVLPSSGVNRSDCADRFVLLMPTEVARLA